MGDTRVFYEALKAVYGPSHQVKDPLRSLDGSTLLTDKEAILRRWPEQFEGLFSDQRTVRASSLAKILQADVILELDDPPTREEIKKATMQLKVGKPSGIDGIPDDVYQHGGDAVLDKPQDKFTNCWEKGTVSEDLRDAVIVSMYKTKGKIRLFKLPRHHQIFHYRQNLGPRLTEQVHPNDSEGKQKASVGSGPTEGQQT